MTHEKLYLVTYFLELKGPISFLWFNGTILLWLGHLVPIILKQIIPNQILFNTSLFSAVLEGSFCIVNSSQNSESVFKLILYFKIPQQKLRDFYNKVFKEFMNWCEKNCNIEATEAYYWLVVLFM